MHLTLPGLQRLHEVIDGLFGSPLYLNAGLKLSFAAPTPGDAAFDEYVSDPSKPVAIPCLTAFPIFECEQYSRQYIDMATQ